MDMRKITCVAAATFVGSLLILSATAPVHAQPLVVEGHHYFDPQIQRVINYADLDLANPSGQKRLLHRVSSAVDDLCAVNDSLASRDMFGETRNCSTAAWNSATPQIRAAVDGAKSGSFVSAAALTITSSR
jgi:UrcA family protein